MICITGTHAFGPATEDSDIDIVMIKSDSLAQELSDGCNIYVYQSNTQREKPHYDGFYFELSREFPRINIIEVEDETELNAWIYATKEMKKLKPILVREERIRRFESFLNQGKELYK